MGKRRKEENRGWMRAKEKETCYFCGMGFESLSVRTKCMVLLTFSTQK